MAEPNTPDNDELETNEVETVDQDASIDKKDEQSSVEADSTKEESPSKKDDDSKKDQPKKKEKRSKKNRERKQAEASKSKPKPVKMRSGLSTPIWVVIALVCAIAGGLIGHFAFGGASGSALSGRTSVSEGELDTTIATYTYNGQTTSVSIRDVINASSTLEASKNDDGTYKIPSADNALSYVRNEIVMKEAENRGINVSDDDVAAYAEETLGSSDFDSIASSYNMDSDTVKSLIRDSATMKALRDQVVTTQSATAPTAPTQPADGNTEATSADYAKYIIDLAGDEWDAQNNTWKSTDGVYASKLSSYTITNDSASYAAAQAAYYVAYQQYSTTQSAVSSEWTDFVNGLLCNGNVTLSSLVA